MGFNSRDIKFISKNPRTILSIDSQLPPHDEHPSVCLSTNRADPRLLGQLLCIQWMLRLVL